MVGEVREAGVKQPRIREVFQQNSPHDAAALKSAFKTLAQRIAEWHYDAMLANEALIYVIQSFQRTRRKGSPKKG